MTTVVLEQTAATLTAVAAVTAVATVVTTTVATLTAMAARTTAVRHATAAVTGNSGRLSAHEGDRHQAEENGRSDSIETLHSQSPERIVENHKVKLERDMRSRSRHENQTGPGRPPDRKVDPHSRESTVAQSTKTSGQPAAFPRKRCGLVKSFRLGKLVKKANTGYFGVKNLKHRVFLWRWRKNRHIQPVGPSGVW